MGEKISLGFEIDTGGAERAIKGLESAFSAVKTVAAAVVAGFAANKIGDFFASGIESAEKQEEAMARLGQQLKLTGDFSTGALNNFKSFADQMESTTKYSDDLVLSQLAVAKSFGVTNAASEKLVTAATELSAVTGDSLESSVEQLGKTLEGVAGKSPALKGALSGLTEESLKAGAGIDAVLKRFGGSAAAELNTFAGSVLQTKNAFGNLQEAFGNVVVQNPVVIKVIKDVGDALRTATAYIEQNGDSIRGGLNKGIELTISGFSKLFPVAKTANEVFKDIFVSATTVSGAFLQLYSGIAKTAEGNAILKAFGSTMLTISQTVVDSLGAIATGATTALSLVGIKLPEIGTVFADLSIKLDGLQSDLDQLDLPRALDEATSSLADFQVAGESAFDAVGRSIDETGKKVEAYGKSLAELPNTVAGPTGGPGGPSAVAKKDEGLGVGAKIGLAAATAGAAGGQEGAKALFASIGSGIGDAIMPGIGAGIGAAINLLGQDPEAFKKAIDGFVEGIPTIIDNIVKNIPYLVESLASHSGEIITALANASPRIAIALAESMPIVAKALAQEMAQGIEYQLSKLNVGLTLFQSGIATAGTNFATGIKTAVGEAGQTFIDAVIDAGRKLVSGVSGGGGGENYGSRAGKAILTGGFSEVPTGGLGLTSGGGSSLSSTGGFGSIDTMQAILLQILNAVQAPITVNAQATVKEQAFADIILDLNRRNARLTA